MTGVQTDIVREQVYDLAAGYDAIILEALGVSREEFRALDHRRLSRVKCASGAEVIHLDGTPLVTLHPVTVTSSRDHGVVRVVHSFKYKIHTGAQTAENHPNTHEGLGQ